MSVALTTAEKLRVRRELRMEIARRRRRIQHGMTGVEQAGRRMISWRRQVARHPLAALATAFGVGWTVSAGMPRRGWVRWLMAYGIKNAIARLPAAAWEHAAGALAGAIAATRRN